MLRKLRIKFVCVNMLIVTLMLLVIFGLVFKFTQANLEQQSVSMMEQLAEDPFRLSLPGERREDIQLPYFVLQLGRSGDLIAVTGGYYDLSDQDFLAKIIEAAISSGKSIGTIEEYNLRYCRVINPMNQRLVFVDISSERATLKSLTETCAMLGLLSLGVFFGISLLLARWAVKPVDKAWQQQRQFVADASHELKTPLAVIMTNAQMLEQPEFEPDQRSQFASSILTMSRQMRSLVEDLLELARADSGQSRENISQLDYSKLVSDCVLPFEPVYYEKGLALDTQVEPGISLEGRQQQLRQLTDILLDNAGKYSLPGGPVTLRLSRQGGRHCLLSVSNPAQEMSREECRDIFKRFYRADKARSRDGSYGLGLSIAESIVEAHGGKISCEYAQGKANFNVVLPLKQPGVSGKN